MPILTVGPTSTYATIADAMLVAVTGDEIQLESGYSNETATVTVDGITVTGDATSTGIVLELGLGIPTFALGGLAPINVLDAADGNGITGNAGDNIVTVTGGANSVNGGAGTGDRLVVDWHTTMGAVTGNSTSNFADAGTGDLVTITGGFEHFTILTGSGADTITTGAGDDIIDAGDGANTIVAGDGNNTVTGGADADSITTGSGDDIIDGGDGANTIVAGAGANDITGGADADTITALNGGNTIRGGDGFNNITSGSGADVITGGLGTDVIEAGGGNDLITVNGGDDTVHASSGTDRLIVDYAALTGAVTLNDFTGGAGNIGGPAGNSVVFDGVENLTITTGSGNDNITTGAGADVLSGKAGDDTLNGGAGVDDLDGGADNDALTGGAGNDTIDGGSGTDTAFYSGARSDYTLTFLSPTQFQVTDNRGGSPDGTDVLTNVEFLKFSDELSAVVFDNLPPVITSTPSANIAENSTAVITVTATDPDLDTPVFSLAGGADQALFSINAATGALAFINAPDFENPADVGANNIYNVIVQASDGNGGVDNQAIAVTVTNVAGATIDGTKHKDLVDLTHSIKGEPMATGEEDHISGQKGKDTLSGLGGNDNIKGGKGKDNLHGDDGNDVLKGSKGKDTLHGDDGADVLKGSRGNDHLYGGNDNDFLNGAKGNDKLYGDGGDDYLVGKQGVNKLFGGDGNDSFVFNSHLKDSTGIVKDFSTGDTVVLSHNIFAKLDVGALSEQDFNKYFDYKHGDLSYDKDGHGKGHAEYFATFAHNVDLHASDFLVI